MKKTSLRLLYALIFALSGAVHAAGATLGEHKVQWKGSMPAKAHEGLIPVKSLEAAVDGQGELTSLKVTLDMAALSVTDLKKEKDRLKLEGHLKSKDFFLVSEHPTATFALKSHKEGVLNGTLTIRGVTKEVLIPATLVKTPSGDWELKSEFSFNRQEFNVNYQNSGILGTAKDKLIRDEVEVSVHLVFGL